MARILDTQELGERVRLRRIRKHLSQQELARKSGLSRSTIVDVERGRNVSVQVALRILRALDAELVLKVPEHEQELRWTADKTARAIKRELRNGDPDFAMRALVQACSYFDRLDNIRRMAFLDEPSPTGRRRWDALLARAVAYKCGEYGITPPAWTEVSPLNSTWYAIPRRNASQAWKNRVAAHTPREFDEAGIKFDARNLASL